MSMKKKSLRIQSLLKENDISHTEYAERIGMSRQTFSLKLNAWKIESEYDAWIIDLEGIEE